MGEKTRTEAKPKRVAVSERSRPAAKMGRSGTDLRALAHAAPPPAGSLLSVVRVETTIRETYDRECGLRKRPVLLKPDREIDSDETWMFIDGSASGWHGLVVLRRGQGPRLVARETRMAMKNVGAEVNALLLGLQAASQASRLRLVEVAPHFGGDHPGGGTCPAGCTNDAHASPLSHRGAHACAGSRRWRRVPGPARKDPGPG